MKTQSFSLRLVLDVTYSAPDASIAISPAAVSLGRNIRAAIEMGLLTVDGDAGVQTHDFTVTPTHVSHPSNA